jgi:hypothetical protein
VPGIAARGADDVDDLGVGVLDAAKPSASSTTETMSGWSAM